MEAIGALGAALLSALYDNPLVAAGLGTVALVVGVLVARRVGLGTFARRHRVASVAAGVFTLAVVAPLAWYLLSPVFIRSTLVEPPVEAAAPPSPTVAPPSPTAVPPEASAPGASPSAVPSPASMPSSPPPMPVATPAPAPTPTPWTAAAPRTGSFTGTDDFHFGRGTATLVETAPGEWTVRLEDFSVRNGPDLYVYLSPERRDYAKGAVELAKLKATDGSFNVRVPAGSDVSGMRSVLIWCRQFSHLFAYATLEG